jgi:hypothetical protein
MEPQERQHLLDDSPRHVCVLIEIEPVVTGRVIDFPA